MAKRYRDVRGDVGVPDNAGWKRAWLVISGGIFILMTLLALKNPNVLNVSISNSSMDCVPGTYSESTGQPREGIYQSGQAQVPERTPQIAGTRPGDFTSVQARAPDERGAPRDDRITTFSCTSYLGLVFAFVAAALLSIGLAILFRLARWLYGFRRN